MEGGPSFSGYSRGKCSLRGDLFDIFKMKIGANN